MSADICISNYEVMFMFMYHAQMPCYLSLWGICHPMKPKVVYLLHFSLISNILHHNENFDHTSLYIVIFWNIMWSIMLDLQFQITFNSLTHSLAPQFLENLGSLNDKWINRSERCIPTWEEPGCYCGASIDMKLKGNKLYSWRKPLCLLKTPDFLSS